jgi:mannose-6-phosphate isomerase
VYAGKLLHVDAGHRLSRQLHREKDETSYLLSGRLRLTQGPSPDHLQEKETGPGHVWRVEPGTVHSIEAIEDSVVLEVSTPHLDDVVRLQDRYGRAADGTKATGRGRREPECHVGKHCHHADEPSCSSQISSSIRSPTARLLSKLTPGRSPSFP